nr:MAG TPA: hypothetical protein [Caudoviricetes sp.]
MVNTNASNFKKHPLNSVELPMGQYRAKLF